MKIIVNDKCNSCGVCRLVCPKGGKIWKINKKAKATNLEYCHLCMICATKCPTQAIKIIR